MTDIERLEDKIDGLLIAARRTADPSTSSVIFKMQVENKALQDKVFEMFDRATRSLETIDKRIYTLESWVDTRKLELSNEKGRIEGSMKTGVFSWKLISSFSGFLLVIYYLSTDIIDRLHK